MFFLAKYLDYRFAKVYSPEKSQISTHETIARKKKVFKVLPLHNTAHNLFFPLYQENESASENNFLVKLIPKILQNLIHGKFPPLNFLPLEENL